MALIVLPFSILMLSITGHASCTWCVCKELPESTLQKTLDYACGAGADCGPIHSNGPCFQPNSVRAHCSYAVNSFFQKKGQSQGSCDFAGTATVSISDPSRSGCSYPATASSGAVTGTGTGTGVSPTPVSTSSNSSTNTPSSSTSTTPATTTSPYSTTPSSNGVLGGGGGGGGGGLVSPVGGAGAGGAGINTDITDEAAGFRVASMSSFYCFLASIFIAMFLWV